MFTLLVLRVHEVLVKYLVSSAEIVDVVGGGVGGGVVVTDIAIIAAVCWFVSEELPNLHVNLLVRVDVVDQDLLRSINLQQHISSVYAEFLSSN